MAGAHEALRMKLSRVTMHCLPARAGGRGRAAAGGRKRGGKATFMIETRDLDTRAHGPPPRPRPPSRLALCIPIAAGRGGLWSLCGAFCGELVFPPFPLSFCFPLLDSSGSLPYCGGEEGGRAAFLPYGVSSAPPPLAAGECCTWTFPCENARACVSHAPPRPRPRGSRHTKSFPPGPRRATQSQ